MRTPPRVDSASRRVSSRKDALDLSFDQVHGSGLKDVPVVSWLAKAIGIGASVRDHIFAKKLVASVVGTSTASANKIADFLEDSKVTSTASGF